MYKKTTYIQKLVALINSLIRIIFLWWIPFNSSFFCTCLYQNLFIYIGEDIASTQYITINTKKILLYKKQKKKLCNLFTQLARQYISKENYLHARKKEEEILFFFFFDTGFLCYTSAGYVHCTCKREVEVREKILND